MGRRGSVGATRAALLVALLVALMTACRPLYIPLAPDAPAAPAPVVVGSDSSLTWSAAAGRLELRLSVSGIGEPGWLAIQWFHPNGAEAASGSLWLEADEGGSAPSDAEAGGGALRVLHSPPDIDLTPGEWRAVVSWQGVLLRQFRAEVPARTEE